MGINDTKLRKWLLSISAFLRNQNRGVADAVELWKKNVDKVWRVWTQCGQSVKGENVDKMQRASGMQARELAWGGLQTKNGYPRLPPLPPSPPPLPSRTKPACDNYLSASPPLPQEFEGVEPCLICYSVISATNSQLPRLQCRTCAVRFHPACLYKWFKSSGKSQVWGGEVWKDTGVAVCS